MHRSSPPPATPPWTTRSSSHATSASPPSSARPSRRDLADADIGLIGVPFDGGVTNRPGARHGPREVRNQSSLLRPVNTATGSHPLRRPPHARPRRLLDRAALRPGRRTGRDRSLLPPGRRGRRDSRDLRRRPLHRLPDPARGGGGWPDRHGPHRRPRRHRRRLHGQPLPARHPVPPRRRGRAARPRALHPDRPARHQHRARQPVAVLGVQRDARHADGRAARPRLALGGRGGPARRRRPALLPFLRHRQPGPGLGARHRHARGRRPHDDRGPAHRPRPDGPGHRRRRHGGGLTAVRRRRDHRLPRRLDAVRDPVRRGRGADGAARDSAHGAAR